MRGWIVLLLSFLLALGFFAARTMTLLSTYETAAAEAYGQKPDFELSIPTLAPTAINQQQQQQQQQPSTSITTTLLTEQPSPAPPPPPTPSPNKPKIAFLVPVISTTEHLIQDLPLFSQLLPSLLPTLELNAFDYKLFLGADVGDRIFDNEATRRAIEEHFAQVAPGVAMEILTFSGNRGAPCWIWNLLAKAAYEQNFDYFYQINDDLQFITRGWSTIFTQMLARTSNVGVVGPTDLNNKRILTQSFVHRSHYEIFGGTYFPHEFRNWYSDDWITAVYPPAHTHKLPQVQVRNGAAGQRYVHDSVAHLVAKYVAEGRDRIASYQAKHGLSSSPSSSMWVFVGL